MKRFYLLISTFLLLCYIQGNAQIKSKYLGKPLYNQSAFTDGDSEYPTSMLDYYNTGSAYDYGKKLRFGFVLGFNFAGFNLIPTTTSLNNNLKVRSNIVSTIPGFGAYALMTYRFNRLFDFRTHLGPMFTQRTIDFSGDTVKSMSIESVMVEMPLHFKYKAKRRGDVRPYLITGVTPSVDVLSFRRFNEKKSIFIGLNSFDIRYDIGLGFDFYMPFFKMSTELRYSLGLINSIYSEGFRGQEQYKNSIDKLFTNMFVLAIFLE